MKKKILFSLFLIISQCHEVCVAGDFFSKLFKKKPETKSLQNPEVFVYVGKSDSVSLANNHEYAVLTIIDDQADSSETDGLNKQLKYTTSSEFDNSDLTVDLISESEPQEESRRELDQIFEDAKIKLNKSVADKPINQSKNNTPPSQIVRPRRAKSANGLARRNSKDRSYSREQEWSNDPEPQRNRNHSYSYLGAEEQFKGQVDNHHTRPRSRSNIRRSPEGKRLLNSNSSNIHIKRSNDNTTCVSSQSSPIASSLCVDENEVMQMATLMKAMKQANNGDSLNEKQLLTLISVIKEKQREEKNENN